jgi:hypothetical protein
MTVEPHTTGQAVVALITGSNDYLSSRIREQGAGKLVLLYVFPMVVGVIAIDRTRGYFQADQWQPIELVQNDFELVCHPSWIGVYNNQI